MRKYLLSKNTHKNAKMNACFNTAIAAINNCNCARCLPPWGSGSGTRWCERGSWPSSVPPCTAPCPAAAASPRACRSEGKYCAAAALSTTHRARSRLCQSSSSEINRESRQLGSCFSLMLGRQKYLIEIEKYLIDISFNVDRIYYVT